MSGDRPPRWAEIVDWLENRLDDEQAARVGRAVESGDPATLAALRWFAGFNTTARAMPLEAPPPIVAQRLRQAFVRWSAGPRGPRADPVELIADLVFDSRRDLDLVGLRSADDPDRVVYLAFRAPGADLVVDLRHAETGTLDIEGQVFVESEGVTASVFEAAAEGDGWALRTVDGDELGRFHLSAVPRDELVLRVTNGEIVLTAALDLRDVES